MVRNIPAMRETWLQSLGQGRSLGEGNGYPLQYSCLENYMDRGAWRVTVHGVTKSLTRLSNFTFTLKHFPFHRNHTSNSEFLVFLKNLHNAFHSSCTSLHCHQQFSRVPLSPHTFSSLLFYRLFNNGHSEWPLFFLFINGYLFVESFFPSFCAPSIPLFPFSFFFIEI